MNGKGRTAAVIVAAGNGSRVGGTLPKQYQTVEGVPMLRHSVFAFSQHPAIDDIVVVHGAGQEALARQAVEDIPVTTFVEGGDSRRESVRNALFALQNSGGAERVLIHDAARPFLSGTVIDRLLASLHEFPGAVPALPVVDSLARSEDGKSLRRSENREGLWRIQTPQAFAFEAILNAHQNWNAGHEATDDARMAMAFGHTVALVEGDERLTKFTFPGDFPDKQEQTGMGQRIRTGMGFDVHRLAQGEELWLCGIRIPHDRGLAGHSDADVALHALTDAVLGAAALGDIGDHFPPSDPQWKGASSDRFLAHAVQLAADLGFQLLNVDVTIICEAPKIAPHKAAMRRRVGEILDIAVENVSIKATTTERLGYTGRGEGIAAQAVATLEKRSRYAR